ncbi:baculoviral IAP repeat-containing protein 5-like [Orbicella faveolata]|uniref:baculoviral IAP repeat-containing protein 5-like n=1 Tax=Orbicella faveolata TaxID=48498 RepID=UPI0009E359C0|nr:baculoviral IAP repeat-containing protein 5-like [Orbicella faveolata]
MAELNYDFNMNQFKNRLETFKDWPFTEETGSSCTARKMAEAGFFHSSNDRDPDIARCFVCFKELEGWEPEDNPLEEHRTHSPKCEFLSLNKKEEDWTVEDFLELETKRQINRMQKIIELKVKEYKELAQHAQSEMEKLV